MADARPDPQPLDSTVPAASPRAAGAAPVRRLDSRDLLGRDNEVEIDHAGLIYRLRRTSLGKLILTK